MMARFPRMCNEKSVSSLQQSLSMIRKEIEDNLLKNHIEYLFLFQIQGGSSGFLSHLILLSAQRQSELMY